MRPRKIFIGFLLCLFAMSLAAECEAGWLLRRDRCRRPLRLRCRLIRPACDCQRPEHEDKTLGCAKLCPKLVVAYHLDSSGNVAFVTYSAECCDDETATYFDGPAGLHVPQYCTEGCISGSIPVPEIGSTGDERYTTSALVAGLEAPVAMSASALGGTSQTAGYIQLPKDGVDVWVRVVWFDNAARGIAVGAGFEIEPPCPVPVPGTVIDDEMVDGNPHCRHVRATVEFETRDYLVFLTQ